VVGQPAGAIEALLDLAGQIEAWWREEQRDQHAEARAADDHVRFLVPARSVVFAAALRSDDVPPYGTAPGRSLHWPAPPGWWLHVHEPWRIREGGTTIEYHLPEGSLRRAHGPDDRYEPPLDFRLLRGRADPAMLEISSMVKRPDRHLLNRYAVLQVPVDERATREEIGFSLLLGALERGWLDAADQDRLALAIEETAAEPLRILRHRPRRYRTRWVLDDARPEEGDDSVIREAHRSAGVTVRRVPASVRNEAEDGRVAVIRLLEALIDHWDPMRGAEDVRRYVRKTARSVGEGLVAGEPWQDFGLKKTAYYTALRAGGRKQGGYFDPHDPINRQVLEAARAQQDRRSSERSTHADAMNELLDHGFSVAGARKQLQRHTLADAVQARPRRRRR